jgi:DNA-binding transcriptional ArsR family regulator
MGAGALGRNKCFDSYITVCESRGVATAVFEVLAEPSRRRILDLLRDRERPVGELVAALGLSQPGVSKHLRVLREAGLVGVRAAGQRRLYRVRPEALRELDDWLTPYRALWGSALNDLAATVGRFDGPDGLDKLDKEAR